MSGRGFVGGDAAVSDVNDALATRGDVGFVGHDEDGLALAVEFGEEVEDFDAGLGVEVSGRLVGEQDGGPLDECPGDGDALALTAGHLVGSVVHSIGEADAGERLGGAGVSFSGAGAGVDQGQFHVAERGLAGEQLEGLEDEADAAAPDAGQLGLVEPRDLSAVEPVGAGGGNVEKSKDVH